MNTQGVHLVCELSGCAAEVLADPTAIRGAMETAAACANVLILDGYFHKFAPSGVTGLLCLSESHFSIHTWPECGYAAADIYTCGEAAQPRRAIESLAQALSARHVQIRELNRGVAAPEPGIFSSKESAGR